MKTTMGMESSVDLKTHSTDNADGEIWLWGPQKNSDGDIEWGIKKGRYGSVYSVCSFYSRAEAVAELRRMRRERAENHALAHSRLRIQNRRIQNQIQKQTEHAGGKKMIESKTQPIRGEYYTPGPKILRIEKLIDPRVDPDGAAEQMRQKWCQCSTGPWIVTGTQCASEGADFAREFRATVEEWGYDCSFPAYFGIEKRKSKKRNSRKL